MLCPPSFGLSRPARSQRICTASHAPTLATMRDCPWRLRCQGPGCRMLRFSCPVASGCPPSPEAGSAQIGRTMTRNAPRPHPRAYTYLTPAPRAIARHLGVGLPLGGARSRLPFQLALAREHARRTVLGRYGTNGSTAGPVHRTLLPAPYPRGGALWTAGSGRLACPRPCPCQVGDTLPAVFQAPLLTDRAHGTSQATLPARSL